MYSGNTLIFKTGGIVTYYVCIPYVYYIICVSIPSIGSSGGPPRTAASVVHATEPCCLYKEPLPTAA